MIAAYRESDRGRGKAAMTAAIEALGAGVLTALTELRRLGRTLKQRAADVLAYVDRPGTSNGPTEAFIIWGPSRGVADVADGADRVRERHVLWSMSLTRTGWICLSLLAFPRPGRCQRVRRGHVPDDMCRTQLCRAHRGFSRELQTNFNGRLEHLRGSTLGFRQPHQLHRQIPTRSQRLQPGSTGELGHVAGRDARMPL